MDIKITYFYDKNSDEMNMFFGKPQKTIALEIKEGVYLELDPKDKAIKGITILHFKKQAEKADKKNQKFETSIPFEGGLFLGSKIKRQLISI